MAKAKSRLWAFRYPLKHDKEGGLYVLWRGTKPRKRKGNWPKLPPHYDKVRTNWGLREREFEAIFPMYCLDADEGPVEIRFAEP